jgi:outer membrane immunogenic protein
MRTQAPHIVEGFALLFLASTLPAAADGPVPADPYRYSPPPVADEYNWSGIYLGAHVGGGTAAWDWQINNPLERVLHHGESAEVGAQFGVQKQWHSLLLGAEASYTWGDLGASTNSAVLPGVTRSSDLSNLLILAGRFGVTWQDLLAYTKVGYASAEIAFRTTTTGGLLSSSSAWEPGWVAGLGIEYALRPDITLGVEYDYIHLDTGVRDQFATPIGIVGGRVSGSVEVQSVVARLNFKFVPAWLDAAPPLR